MTVVLVDPRRPSLVPVEAIEFLTGDVQYTEEMPIKVPWTLPAARPIYGDDEQNPAPVLLSSDPEHPAVKARLAAGDRLIAAPQAQAGERLVDAVAMMDKLRTAGPWESEQTHDSLRRYLLEETYELFDAVRGGNADELREELGDVLLQVLFHARIAEDAPVHPFSIDDVADALVRKLGNRVPAVLAGETISLDEQLAQWEERKAQEQKVKARGSSMDDVPTGQPALALAQKVLARVAQAGLPADLVPAALTSVAVSADVDAENDLRSAVLEFMDTVRLVESDVAAGRRGEDVPEELDVTPLGSITEDEWRTYWPTAVPEVDEFEEVDSDDAEYAGESEEPAQAEDIDDAHPDDADAAEVGTADTGSDDSAGAAEDTADAADDDSDSEDSDADPDDADATDADPDNDDDERT